MPISTDADTGDVLDEVKVALSAAAPAGVTALVTGPAGFTADLAAGFAGIDGILLAVALGAVLIILIIVYRSLLLPVAVLATSLSALTVALLSVWWLAKADILLFSGQTQGILFILVIGAATDYALLYVARYREQLRLTESRGQATMSALRGSIEPILASGGTVIAGLLCLMLSDLKSNSSLGPVASIGILFAMAAALTLLPAILYAFGRAAFWPRRPKFDPAAVEAEHGMPSKGVWAWLARIIKRRPRVIWLATTALLLLGAVGALQLNAQGVAQSELVLGASDARDGQAELGEHFPGGSGSPANVVTDEGQFDETADALLAIEGVDSLSVVADDSPSGTAPVTEDGIGAIGPPGTPAPEPTAVDGKVMLQATLSDAADSDAATDTVLQMRESIEAEGLNALVGGTTATAIDTNEASIHDRNLIIPIVLVVILLILMVLLRSVLAPVLLVLTTVVSFGTAMGVSAIVFNHVFEFPGSRPCGAALRLRLLGGARHRLQHLPDDARARRVGQAWHPRGHTAGARRHRRRHHVGGNGAGRDLCGAVGDPHPVPGADRVHRRLRRAAGHVPGARTARASAQLRHRQEDLVAVEAVALTRSALPIVENMRYVFHYGK